MTVDPQVPRVAARAGDPLRVLSVATMYPTPAAPESGIFVARRIEALARRVRLEVAAPVPFFPLVARVVPRYFSRRATPRRGRVGALEVSYPRYLSIPGFVRPLEGFSLALAIGAELRRLRRAGFCPHLLDAHLAYPEGFACALVARRLGLAVAVTVRGHDLNELPAYPAQGRQVRYALRRADRVLAVAEALARRAVELGAAPDRVVVSRNGVDTTRFFPGPRALARRRLGLPEGVPLLLSIGYLVPRKGFHHLIAALAELPRHRDAQLLIVGGRGGEEYVRPQLERQASALGVGDRVRFVGPRPQDELGDWYRACDLFALASEKEGTPNVVLEALACGRPVVATRAWGIPEVVSSDDLGYLVSSPPAAGELAACLARALDREWQESRVLAHAGCRSWDLTAEEVEGELRAACGRTGRGGDDGQAERVRR